MFLVQAEVADRIAAAPGSKTYGGLSVGVQTLCRVEKLFVVRGGLVYAAAAGAQRGGPVLAACPLRWSATPRSRPFRVVRHRLLQPPAQAAAQRGAGDAARPARS